MDSIRAACVSEGLLFRWVLDLLTRRLVRRIRTGVMAVSGCCPFLVQSDV